MPFYNTNKSTTEEAEAENIKTNKQENSIMDYFQNNSPYEFTPFEINDAVLFATPITSVRRAMTNLTDKGFLEKTDRLKIGRYGKKNHVWKLLDK